MADFTASVFQNEYLSDGATDAHAVVSVTCSGAGTAGTGTTDAAEMLIIDTSGSMDLPSAKIKAARQAAKVAVDEIVDGTWFAVVAASTSATMCYPLHPQMARMDSTARAAAKAAIDDLRPQGSTAIGTWLLSANELFATAPATQRHAILLTDGKIEGEPPDVLPNALAQLAGRFQCDCRGIGADWRVDELRGIATALLGTVDIVAEPAELEADFEAMMRASMGRGVAQAALRVWAPQGSEVLFVRQVAPEVLDLTPTATRISPLIIEIPTGAWGDETARLPRRRAGAGGAARQRAARRQGGGRRRRPGGRQGTRPGGVDRRRQPDHPYRSRRRPLHRTGPPRRSDPAGPRRPGRRA